MNTGKWVKVLLRAKARSYIQLHEKLMILHKMDA